ncbi:hypothetical protein [Ekhidna sp.]
MNQDKEVSLKRISINGESFYKISNSDAMRPFFMSVVSDSNHWMFISSNGGLSAGRKDAENALFPYYTDDKITESFDVTGSKSIFWVSKNSESFLWEPFSKRNEGRYRCTRNLFKSEFGNKILFEEINHDLEVTFRYKWSSSNKFGFIKESHFINHSNERISLRLLDGIQNIMPYGVSADLQGIRSNLVDAYKRNELVSEIGLGIYALSAIIVDRAEPSEALKANIAWSLGLENATYLLSSTQLDAFRKGEEIEQETDIKAEKGAYFISSQQSIDQDSWINWLTVANVNQDANSIAELSDKIRSKGLWDEIKEDIEVGSQRLLQRVAASDGLQLSADKKRNARHFSNTLFNIMRGGIFDENYQIEKWDFNNYLSKANSECFVSTSKLLDSLNDTFTLQELRSLLKKTDNKDFHRLALEYMPLKFSRRHGDPSRPWNKFSINTRNEVDGSKILDYEGNWRDIFQNWEALAHSYPAFIDNMIIKFLNASTFDGYNPYRVTKDGFDWETIEPHDPWSYIGYWGDHQIIYLLKFLEFIHDYYPKGLEEMLDQDHFVYANVPYRIKAYEDILNDPKDTILFDEDLDREIRNKRDEIGADGALLTSKGSIYRVNFIEKILATVLAKVSNFIPEGGIWLNTQRPEWNDANNALVGNGVSMVTLYYLRRFLSFFKKVLADQNEMEIALSKELLALFQGLKTTLESNLGLLNDNISSQKRREIVDGLGIASSDYRNLIYNEGFSSEKESLKIAELNQFIDIVLSYLDHSIEANRRSDGMYHSYNLMTVEKNGGITISYLDEMLEGQVAVLSSGYLEPEENLEVLNSLKSSRLFREDQYSYLLYPNKELPGFLSKNIIPSKLVKKSALLSKLAESSNRQIIQKDITGKYHFNGDFKNAGDLKLALSAINQEYSNLAKEERELILEIFEDVFDHKSFTGRSGTFFGYEGLGSIYWHMVSKLLLAVEECCQQAVDSKQSDAIVGQLLEHYYEINEGIGVHKSPKLYGAFPIDPYSHTPLTKGAQQPGMTGQVKEDILSRKGEIGVFVKNGEVHFNPSLLRKNEFLTEDKLFSYIDVNLYKKSIPLSEGSMAFTYCQVPIIYCISEKKQTEIVYQDGSSRLVDSQTIDSESSTELFNRSGSIESIKVELTPDQLK